MLNTNNDIECKIIELSKVGEARGDLFIAEFQKEIPFQTNRIFFINSVPKDTIRGKHAHKVCEQFLICLNGEVEVSCINKQKRFVFKLKSPNKGVYIPSMTWTEIKYKRKNSLLMVLASHLYDKNDYIKEKSIFI